MAKKILNVVEDINAFMIFVIAFSVFFQLPARMIFHIPATWSVEIGRAAFTAVVFLGTPVLIFNESQMVIGFVKDSVKSRKGRMAFDIIGDIFIYFFEITLAYGCYNRMIAEWKVAIPTVEFLTYGYIYLVMFIGSLLMIYTSILVTKKHFANKEGELK